jgi:phospholipid-transporting ATPase
MQAIPYISISEGVPVIFLPLVVIIFISGFKDFYEDYKRKKSDNEENSRKILVFEKDKFIHKEWKDILVGNIVKVRLIYKFLSMKSLLA